MVYSFLHLRRESSFIVRDRFQSFLYTFTNFNILLLYCIAVSDVIFNFLQCFWRINIIIIIVEDNTAFVMSC